MGDLGKLINAKGFKKLPKVQKIAQSGQTERDLGLLCVALLVPGLVGVADRDIVGFAVLIGGHNLGKHFWKMVN